MTVFKTFFRIVNKLKPTIILYTALLIIGTFLSITYFIVIPIIPDKNDPSIITDIKIPILLPSLTLNFDATNTPSVSPDNDPTNERAITSGKLFP